MKQAGYGWALWLFNFTTETRDAIGAIYKALPCDVRSKADDTAAKQAQRIYDNLDRLNVDAMMTELYLNQIEDYVIGRASGAINKAFGSGESWSNYYRAFQEGNQVIPDLGKITSSQLDALAKSLNLPRIRCGGKKKGPVRFLKQESDQAIWRSKREKG